MSSLRTFCVALAIIALPASATPQLLATPDEIINKVIAQEQSEVQLLRQYSPLVETYIQYFRLDQQLDAALPDGDKYFLGRAHLAKGVQLEPLDRGIGLKSKFSEGWREFVNN